MKYHVWVTDGHFIMGRRIGSADTLLEGLAMATAALKKRVPLPLRVAEMAAAPTGSGQRCCEKGSYYIEDATPRGVGPKAVGVLQVAPADVPQAETVRPPPPPPSSPTKPMEGKGQASAPGLPPPPPPPPPPRPGKKP